MKEKKIVDFRIDLIFLNIFEYCCGIIHTFDQVLFIYPVNILCNVDKSSSLISYDLRLALFLRLILDILHLNMIFQKFTTYKYHIQLQEKINRQYLLPIH